MIIGGMEIIRKCQVSIITEVLAPCKVKRVFQRFKNLTTPAIAPVH